jgi:hypothetical protein
LEENVKTQREDMLGRLDDNKNPAIAQKNYQRRNDSKNGC